VPPYVLISHVGPDQIIFSQRMFVSVPKYLLTQQGFKRERPSFAIAVISQAHSGLSLPYGNTTVSTIGGNISSLNTNTTSSSSSCIKSC
jgi:hypothetical protein